MLHLSQVALRPIVAALALATLSVVAVNAEDAKPADKSLANSFNLEDKTAERDEKLLAKDAAVKVEDGKYFDAEGHPTFHVSDNGKKFDWYAYSGYRRYHAECHVCHGPDGMGSTYAPALKDSLKHLSYEEFIGILAGGKQDVSSSDQKVMPAFGDNKNVMCYADDLYVYLKARASGAMGRIRPGDKEEKPEAAKKAEKECMGG
ncbi:c-type cytochrome, methanol metabolism-related [Methylobacterium planeticum]|uniref:C-type cytochrome, methanol metabolism-related n=1 Tax=Methylobacterium planeticum TaxID=2615211 RepID=A0A6N6MMJ2_9HYPH|nr:c-type cytochrome, methanol metabolism-related [Methylobacterium planeticum]KAB1071989.1 c-type cytochrome, methanol metabolism-related [Methylobacterium planeticum]